jgi:membrane associated rhomboid family serine protease
MLSDRPYMRDYPGSRRQITALTWILAILVAGFIVQNGFELAGNTAFFRLFALSSAGFRHGQIWQLLTYPLLHGGVFHLLCNGLGLYFLGKELQPLLGNQRLTGLLVASAVMGGLVWAAVHFGRGGTVIGCSSAVCALLVVFACFYPDREITLLLFFVIPVTLKPKYIVLITAAITVFGVFFYEIPGRMYDIDIAHSAHLGGMLAGLCYYRLFHRSNLWDLSSRPAVALPRWLKRPVQPTAVGDPGSLPKRDDLRAEVDRILDKINSSGFGALTAEEKRVLDSARDLLSRR